MYYFGPYRTAGHHFYKERGGHVSYDEQITIPWTTREIDGKLQPHVPGCRGYSYKGHSNCYCGNSPEGIALVHHKNGWTALSFWDRSVDTRGASSSTYVAEGEFDFDQMVAMAKERFADRWAQMKFEVKLAQ
jgi:hypothetical protein